MCVRETFLGSPCYIVVMTKDAKSGEELRREAEHYRKVARYINDDQMLAEIAKLIEELERRAQEIEVASD